MLAIQLSNCTAGHLSQKNKTLCLHKNLYKIVRGSFICNNQKLETTKTSFKKGQ